MKPDTEQIIQSLRAAAYENEKIMDLAADRLEELQTEVTRVKACCEQGDKMLQRLKAKLAKEAK
jgi:hypothetical protein